MTLSIFGQDNDKKAEKEIEKFYYEATDDYYGHSYDTAIKKLEVLDFLYEDNANIDYFLGMCYFFKADFEKAIIHYEQSMHNVIYTNDYQNGKYAPHVMYFYLGYAYEKQGNMKDAIFFYETYIKYERNKKIIFNTTDRIKILKLIYNINE